MPKEVADKHVQIAPSFTGVLEKIKNLRFPADRQQNSELVVNTQAGLSFRSALMSEGLVSCT